MTPDATSSSFSFSLNSGEPPPLPGIPTASAEVRALQNPETDLQSILHPEVNGLLFTPPDAAEYNPVVQTMLSGTVLNFEEKGGTSDLLSALNSYLETSTGWTGGTEQKYRQMWLSDLERVIDAGLSLPEKSAAVIRLVTTPPFRTESDRKYFHLHFDTNQANDQSRGKGVIVRALSTISGDPGLYLPDAHLNRELFVPYTNERKAFEKRLQQHAFRGHGQAEVRSRLSAIEGQMIEWDHASKLFQSFDESQVQSFAVGQFGFMRGEDSPDTETNPSLPGLAHFVPIASARQRCIIDFF